jgi:uncharacterized phiE125 gp8 family phage protein
MLAPVLVTAPAAPVVTLADAKKHLRVDHTDDDDMITALIAAATSYLDGWSGILLGRALVNQTWRQDFHCFERKLRLPLAPVSAVSSVKWRNTDGEIATIAADNYALQADHRGPLVRFEDGYSFPSPLYETGGVLVEFVAGYGASGAAVPPAIQSAIILHVKANYDPVDRDALMSAVHALVAPFRRLSV